MYENKRERGGGLMRMFISDPGNPARTEKIIEAGIQMMRIMCWGYLMMAASMTIGGAMRGAGAAGAALRIARGRYATFGLNWSG
jgi:Na+-driven multidrug efflux pump